MTSPGPRSEVREKIALALSELAFDSTGEAPTEKERPEARLIEDILASWLAKHPQAPTAFDLPDLQEAQEKIRQRFPARSQASRRYKAESLLFHTLFQSAAEGRISIRIPLAHGKPQREAVFDPLDRALVPASRWRTWQNLLLDRMLGYHDADELRLQALSSLQLFGGPCGEEFFQIVSGIVPARDYDPRSGLLAYRRQGATWLRWSCHPMQRIALLRALRSSPNRPIGESVSPEGYLKWLAFMGKARPRTVSQTRSSEIRYLIEVYPPWMVSALSGLVEIAKPSRLKPDVPRPASWASPPEKPELAIRQDLSLARRRHLQGRYSLDAARSFQSACQDLLRSPVLRQTKAGPLATPSNGGRLFNLWALIAAARSQAEHTTSGATLATLISTGAALLDWLGGLPICQLNSPPGKNRVGTSKWNDAEVYGWTLSLMWSAAGCTGKVPKLRGNPSPILGPERLIPTQQDVERLIKQAGSVGTVPAETLRTLTALCALTLRKREAARQRATGVDSWGWPEMWVEGTKTRRSRRRVPLYQPFMSTPASIVLACAVKRGKELEKSLVQDGIDRSIALEGPTSSQWEGPPILPSRLTLHDLDRALAKLSRTVLARRLTAHDLRASAICQAILAGMPLEAASKLAGHAELALTLSFYVHVFPIAQERALSTHLDSPTGQIWLPVRQVAPLLGVSVQAAHRMYREPHLHVTKTPPPGCTMKDTRRRQRFVEAGAVVQHLARRVLHIRRRRNHGNTAENLFADDGGK
ncbi:MAG: tyrosine-type recombinase/integrase [Nitrospirae bacterium]|nr:tyrosine-type recombinase/integrase [Nitrospirota bacterium]